MKNIQFPMTLHDPFKMASEHVEDKTICVIKCYKRLFLVSFLTTCGVSSISFPQSINQSIDKPLFNHDLF